MPKKGYFAVIIGITGGSGTGKSSLAGLLGCEVIDADRLYHKIFEENENLKEELRRRFGTCERKKLADIVFADKNRLDELNAVTFGYIMPEIEKKLLPGRDIAIDAPLLFESGLNKKCDFTVAVLAGRDTRIRRIMARDAISQEKAKMRIDAQKPDAYYIERADCIIQNDGGALEKAASKLKDILCRLKSDPVPPKMC